MSSTFAESFVVAPLFLEAYSDSETKLLDDGTIRHIKACFHQGGTKMAYRPTPGSRYDLVRNASNIFFS